MKWRMEVIVTVSFCTNFGVFTNIIIAERYLTKLKLHLLNIFDFCFKSISRPLGKLSSGFHRIFTLAFDPRT